MAALKPWPAPHTMPLVCQGQSVMKIVVTSNCQTPGIAEALRALLDTDILSKSVSASAWPSIVDALSDADVWVTSFSMPDNIGNVRLPPRLRMIRIPRVWFGAFQPDLTYAVTNGKGLNGLDSAYHSKIALWGWRNGLSTDRVLSLFRPDVFHRLGYFAAWDSEKELLRQSFSDTDLDFTRFWNAISRRIPFMYTANHPGPVVLAAMAKQIAVLIGASESVHTEPVETLCVPKMLARTIWPVYPDIAAYFGFKGMYRWKLADKFIHSLPEFIEKSFAYYRSLAVEPKLIRFSALQSGAFDAVMHDALAQTRS